MTDASVQPRRIRIHATHLCTDVLRTVGYRARCACGYVGPTRGDYADARRDASLHADAERQARAQQPRTRPAAAADSSAG